MQWNQIAIDSLKAAGELLRSHRHRSAVSRAYFASFAALTLRLTEAGLTFGDAEAPPHAAVAELIESNLPRKNKKQRRELKRLFNVLYQGRLIADYRSKQSITAQIAQEALIYGCSVLRLLGLQT